jgi:predicted AlkP superfamily pyrophosphatase or phosphodiesterase
MTDEEIPNLKRFISEGVSAEYVQPIFPSMSFPSWTTIVTGEIKFGS